LFNRIHEFLKSKNIEFEVMEHEPTRTSEESASVRNTPLEWGAKTMLVKGKTDTILLVYRANRKVSWSKLRKLE
jgi:Ala-tRNA(Pro) deacylase